MVNDIHCQMLGPLLVVRVAKTNVHSQDRSKSQGPWNENEETFIFKRTRIITEL